MQITLIRHLRTEWNKKNRLQGRRNIEISPITEDCQKQIEHNQTILKYLSPFEEVFASTLIRTHQTAHLYGYEPKTEDLLDELDFGPFEGLPKEVLIENCGRKWFENPRELVLGESIKDLEKRIRLFLEKYQCSQNILVFGHGSWIRAIVSYNRFGHINNMNKITVGNNECITLSFDGGKIEMEG